MSYKSILVNIDIDGPIAPIVKAAMDIARRYDARLIGLCAADAPLPMAGPEGGSLAAEAWQLMRDDIEKRLKDVRAEFERLTTNVVKTEWREGPTSPTQAVVLASRTADLIIMAASEGASTGDSYRVANPASVVLRAGRPLLIVAGKTEHIRTKKIIVAWKDTREARRAVADAVPLLMSADAVTVVTVSAQVDEWVREGMTDVVAFLTGHNIKARTELIESPDEYIELFKFIDGSDADLVVSGAYGHSRLREWAFGGITRSLLDEAGLSRFMSS
ncbi:universal stress protein [Mesorhizobium sp. CCNWLW179-1]|uniref:universal stress protein n=1 Tax=unclassified Mesorhizobium TaxID=325217 RepID=UPI00301487AD